jgi:hypothetical protein
MVIIYLNISYIELRHNYSDSINKYPLGRTQTYDKIKDTDPQSY